MAAGEASTSEGEGLLPKNKSGRGGRSLTLKELDMIARSVVMISAILLLAGGVSAGGNQKDDKDVLQGAWAIVSQEVSGIKATEDAVKLRKPLVVKGDTWTRPSGEQLTFKIDPAKNPKELDVIQSGTGATWRGIYKIEGDTLTVCRSQGANLDRPKEFKGGKGVALMVYKRLKN
jgi:uncharacterized protein (TIGR03067 family)